MQLLVDAIVLETVHAFVWRSGDGASNRCGRCKAALEELCEQGAKQL